MSNTENKINQIMWGAHFCSVENGQGDSVLLVLKTLSLRDRCFVDFIHKEALQEAKDNDVLTEFEFRTRLKTKNIWNETREEFIETCSQRIKELQEKIKDYRKGDRNWRLTSSLIERHKKSLSAELRRKAELFYITAEQYADEVRNRALVYSCTFDEFENKYWRNWDTFESEKDLELIGNIARELNKIGCMDAREVRKIARSPTWRHMWAAAKGNIQALFGLTVGEFGLDQRSLTYWSQVYDSVYEAYERPSDEIIDNDELLDKWFDEQARKNKTKQLEQSGKSGKVEVSNAVRRHGEVFIVTNPAMAPNTPFRMEPDLPTNEDVENLNSSFVRKLKRKEQEIIKGRGDIREEALRTRKNKIARKAIGSQDAVISKRNFAGKASGKSRIVPGGTL